MEDTKELAKATDLVEQNNEAFDNTFPWLLNPAKTLEEPTCSDCDEQDLITDESIEGAELLPEVKENWWVDIDGINWEWMFPTSISNSDASSPVHDVQVEEAPIAASYPLCTALYDNYVASASPSDGANDKHEVFCNTDEPSEGEELMPKAEDSLSEDIEGSNWDDWIDPNMNSDSDNDNRPVHDTQVEDDGPHITFDNCVAVAQDTFQELNSVSRGDIRSPSEITPIQEADSWSTSPSLSEGEKLRTVKSISSSQGINKCPFLSTVDKISNNNAPPNSLARPDLLSMLKDLAAKLRDLANDINSVVGRLAVESPSDAWIESVFSTTRSVDGSLECKTSLSSNDLSDSTDLEENVFSNGSWDDFAL